MTRWWRSAALGLALVLVGPVAGCASSSPASSSPSSSSLSNCEATLAADEAKVRTTRDFTDADLPGIGNYLEIHWQLRTAGTPCGRGPGPTDWRYQGLVTLSPDAVVALQQAYDWLPLAQGSTMEWDTPEQLWPGLRPFAPAVWGWQHSVQYDEADQLGARWGTLYLDPAAALAFFVLLDH